MSNVGSSSRIVWASTQVTDPHLEQIVGKANFQHPWFLRKGTRLAQAVCKIGNRGTAFLIGDGLLMTNWHVLRIPDWAEGKQAIFGYEQSEDGGIAEVKQYPLNPDEFFYSNEALDVAVVAVDGNPSADYGSIDITNSATLISDTRVNIIQHPNAGLKKIAIRDNGLKFFDDTILQYWTDTEHGSSGSPVFNDSWEIIGLHYRYGSEIVTDGNTIFYNEAHTMAAILEDLRANFPGKF